MAKNQNKTIKTKESVSAFLNGLEDPEQKKDAKAILKLMKEVTGARPSMWGDSIIGFGDYHYKYDSGREGDFFITGFSPRKGNFSLYIMPGYAFPAYKALLKKLGPHKTGKSCLYIKRLSDVDTKVLSQIVKRGWDDMHKYKKQGKIC